MRKRTTGAAIPVTVALLAGALVSCSPAPTGSDAAPTARAMSTEPPVTPATTLATTPTTPMTTPTPSARATMTPGSTASPPTRVVAGPCPEAGAIDDRTSKDRPFTVCGLLVISRKHRVTKTFVPDLVNPSAIPGSVEMTPATGIALAELFAAARAAGHRLVTVYGYRSYALQASFTPSPITAPAGASEHQSGLAVDLAALSSSGVTIRGYDFGASSAGRWVRDNAWRHGFVIRYPDGMESVTGIPYEPWHLRFVGTHHAAAFAGHRSLTLEEYLRID